MSCETIQEYNFCTIQGDTVFAKDFKIEEATNDWEIIFKITSFTNETEFLTVENGKLERLSHNEWRIKEHREELKVGGYNYIMCYVVGSIERLILKGKITVKPH